MARMIYFDYNSTHPPFLDLLHAVVEEYGENFANPSGISYPSQKNQGKIEASRSTIAGQLKSLHGIDASPEQFLFVSTGTEAVHHMMMAYRADSLDRDATALLSPYEHEAMYAACKYAGYTIELLPASRDGRVDPDSIRKRLATGGISLLSVMSVCNETGVIQPLETIGSLSEEFEIPLLSDSIQAAGKLPLTLSAVDGMVLNGHKIGAGFGAAAVWLADPSRYRAIFRGGLQENERRAGTENLPAILALPEALGRQIELLEKEDGDDQIRHRRHDRIEATLRSECGAVIVGEDSPRNSTTYAIFPQMENMDFLLMGLDREQILCSTGSSCRSRTRQPSSTLMRMGFSQTESLQALRFSTGRFTKEDEVDRFCEIFPQIYSRCL